MISDLLQLLDLHGDVNSETDDCWCGDPACPCAPLAQTPQAAPTGRPEACRSPPLTPKISVESDLRPFGNPGSLNSHRVLVADALEAAWQDVDQEPANEFVRRKVIIAWRLLTSGTKRTGRAFLAL
jgi:hypothetical protein